MPKQTDAVGRNRKTGGRSARACPDPVAWAKSQRRNTGGNICESCANPEILAVLQKWAPLWKTGAIAIGVEQARQFLAQHFGYDRNVTSLRRCLANHHGVGRHHG